MQEEINFFCSTVTSEEKSRRGSSLKRLKEILFDSNDVLTEEQLVDAWEKTKKPLARTLTDPAEICRNTSVELWKKFLAVVPINEGDIVHLIPILTRRLSTQELQEPSEEVRLNCVTLLRLVVLRYGKHLAAYSDDLVAILARTVTDNFPDVKRESSACIEELAYAVPAEFYSRSESFVKPILGNFGHQHWKVRAASVRAIGQVLIHGQSRSMEEVATPLAQRLFDQSGAVRLAVVEVAGRWFVELRDRYSWWYKLIPLLATGLHDEVKDIRVRAAQLWDEAGRCYLRENENDERLKDKIDFLADYEYDRQSSEFSNKFKRPNLGCRVIVQQNLGKLVNAIGRELNDWLPDVRVRSAQLLCVLVLNAEQDVVQHLEHLLPAMNRAADDEDSRVTANVELAAEYMGKFVDPSIYCKLILPTLEESPTAGQLRVFASIMSGSDSLSNFPDLPEVLRRLWLIKHSRKRKYQEALLACCMSIITLCPEAEARPEECGSCVAQDLFEIIFTVLATSEEKSSVEEQADRMLESLADLDRSNTEDLCICYLRNMLKSMKRGCSCWSIDCDDFSVFRTAITRFPRAIGMNSDVVVPVLKGAMGEDANKEVKLKVFVLLAEFFDTKVAILWGVKPMKDPYRIEKIGFPILREVVVPALVWSAGRTAEAMRTAALGCLCAVLGNGDEEEASDEKSMLADSLTEEMTKYSRKGFAELIPIVVTLVDENARKNRLYALRAICRILAIGARLSWIDEEIIHATYPAVLKRLDDGCDDVRAAAAEALVHVWRARPKNYDLVFGKSHVDYLYTTGIVHLDDPDPKFRALMLGSMLELAEIHPELLATKIARSRENFRNQSGLDKLLESCHDRLRSKEK